MSFPPSKQLNQEKHHFDKKQDYSSKFNLMKAHGACGKLFQILLSTAIYFTPIQTFELQFEFLKKLSRHLWSD